MATTTKCSVPYRRETGERDLITRSLFLDAGHRSVELTDVADGLGAETETSVNDQHTRIMGRFKEGTERDMWSSDSDRNLWDDSSDSE